MKWGNCNAACGQPSSRGAPVQGHFRDAPPSPRLRIGSGCVLGSYVPGGKVKLDEVSKILGLTGKPEGIDGSRVEEMVLAGQIEEVARYCESDVLNTYRVWLIYELFRGAITAEQLAWSEGQIREFVANQSAPVCGSGHCGSPG